MLTADWRGRAPSVVPLEDTYRSITMLALAAIARAERTCRPLGARSIVVMPLPASAGALNENGIAPASGIVTLTVSPPHCRHPDSSFSSWDWAAGASRNAATAWITWTDFSRLRVSENSAAWYPKRASTVYASGVPGAMHPQHSGRSI